MLNSPSMSPNPADMLLHYRLVEQIGEGGMGIVWKATDTKLDRDVAIKILPPDVSTDARRLARFEREAKSLAALSHPNVAQVHGLEGGPSASSGHFLVMELVQGEDLAARVTRGRLPLTEALEVCLQIAAALEAAHERGIVHRDLKPANVMVGANDRVKLLDFGLARPDRPFGADDAGDDPKAELTKEGAILGTVAYMSPEQLMGRRVNSRTDIFSLGILLFELATGKHPFPGETEASTLAKILEREPQALLEARPGLPKELERIVGRCLEKKPTERYQDTAQVVRELRGLRRGEGTGAAATLEEPRAPRAFGLSRRNLLTAGSRGQPNARLSPEGAGSVRGTAFRAARLRRPVVRRGRVPPRSRRES